MLGPDAEEKRAAGGGITSVAEREGSGGFWVTLHEGHVRWLGRVCSRSTRATWAGAALAPGAGLATASGSGASLAPGATLTAVASGGRRRCDCRSGHAGAIDVAPRCVAYSRNIPIDGYP